LCSKAVDYPKNGIPVSLDEYRIPPTLIRFKPDWQSAEVVGPRKNDYYESTRALGYLYRSIELDDPSVIPSFAEQERRIDVISNALMPHVQMIMVEDVDLESCLGEIEQLFQMYVDELRYICATHTLSSNPGTRLIEEEIVVGTILSKCSEHSWRRGRIYRMQHHTSVLVRSVRRDLEGDCDTSESRSLYKAWCAWNFSVRNRGNFGSNSFGLVALDVIFDLLERLGVKFE
jgi:RNA-dependent RNA polymerase